jgi:predicted nuclease with TOPRIM domain
VSTDTELRREAAELRRRIRHLEGQNAGLLQALATVSAPWSELLERLDTLEDYADRTLTALTERTPPC